MTAAYVDATFYAQVSPTRSHYRSRTSPPDSAKVERITQTKPDKPIAGTVTVKLTIRVPIAAFLPLSPEAVVVVPESMIEANPVEVVAQDPDDGDSR